MRRLLFALAAALGAALSRPAAAATINVAPGDSYAKIEAAGPGDEVVIAPGTYAFRVQLTKAAPAGQPIVIRAQDPSRPPVWDLSSTLSRTRPEATRRAIAGGAAGSSRAPPTSTSRGW